MRRPARSVEPDDTVAAAMVACQRYGRAASSSPRTAALVGAVRREDLDKAIGHGLSHAPVKGIMSGRVPVADEDAALAELQRLLAESGEGRIAVVRDGQVVGVVTRSDLLQALGETVEAPAEPADSIAGDLRRLGRLAPVFEAIAAASDTVDGVYLVGGTVRDILLGEPELRRGHRRRGGRDRLGAALAVALGGRCAPHEKFGTAVVLVRRRGSRVDVVTTRTEFYDAPAALPDGRARDDPRRTCSAATSRSTRWPSR